MEEKGKSKIDLVIGILILIFFIVLDLIDLIPFAGDVTDVVALPVYFYLQTIQVSGVIFLVSEFLDLFPAIQEFPCRTLGWIITWAIDAFAPAKVSQAIETVGELEQMEQNKLAGGPNMLKEGEYIGGWENGRPIIVKTGMSNEELEILRSGGTPERWQLEASKRKVLSEGAEREAGGGEFINEGGEVTEAELAAEEAGGGAREGRQPEIDPTALGQRRELLGEEGELQKELFEQPIPMPAAAAEDAAAAAPAAPPKPKQTRAERFKKTMKDIWENLPAKKDEEDDGGGWPSEGLPDAA